MRLATRSSLRGLPGAGDDDAGSQVPANETEAEGVEPPWALSPPHFECGALPVRTTPPHRPEVRTPCRAAQ
jgi:hypothetical protein